MRTVNFVPSPSLEETSIVPKFRSTSSWTIESPSPEPPACRDRAFIHAVKALKNVLDGVLRNAHARILHQKLRLVLRVAGRHMDASPAWLYLMPFSTRLKII